MAYAKKGGERPGRRRTGRRVSMILILALCFALFPLPADAGEPTAAQSGEIVDIVTLHYSKSGMAALMADGTVRTAGLADYPGEHRFAAMESWTDIVQLVATSMNFLGLRSDGTVVSTLERDLLQDPFDPNHWTNVKELVTSEQAYYGVTNDGRVLVSDDYPDYSFGGGGPYMEWEDIDKLCFYAWNEARGLIGLRRDGTLIHPSDYCFFHEPLTGVTAIDSSGYIHCALLEDGTIRVAGTDVEFAEMFNNGEGLPQSAAAVRDAVQIAVDEYALICRLENGNAVVCASAEWRAYPDVATWHELRDVQVIRGIMVGLDRFGRVHTAIMDGADPDRVAELRGEAESWTDVIRIKAWDGFGYDDPYIIGWRADGSVVAAGLDISGLIPEQTPAVRYTDAVPVSYDGSIAALRDDGSVACTGLTEEISKKIGTWQGITQLCCTGGVLYGLRSDGIVEAVGVDPWQTDSDTSQAEIGKVLSWRDIQALAATNMRLVGLKKDGSIVMTGPSFFGPEQNADFSGWTDLVALQGGQCIGGEYLVGLKTDGIVYKGDSIIGDWYGTPRRAVETACSGFQLLCLEQDGSVVSLGFPGTGKWQQISHVWALDGLALGLRRDGTVAVDVLEGYFPGEAAEQIRSWTDIRSLSVASGGLVVGITNGGQTLVAESDDLVRSCGRDCIDTVRSWTNLDRILWADGMGRVLALRTDGSLISCGIPLP